MRMIILNIVITTIELYWGILYLHIKTLWLLINNYSLMQAYGQPLIAKFLFILIGLIN